MTRSISIFLALILPFITCGLQWLVWDIVRPFVWFLFYPTAFFSSRIGGKYAGIAATVTSALLVYYVFLPPQLHIGGKDPSNILSVLIFIIMGIVFSYTHDHLEKSRIAEIAALEDAGRANEKFTELSRLEKLLKQSNREYAQAQSIAQFGNWSFDIPNNKVTWSEELYRIFDVSTNVFGNSHEAFLERVHPDDRPRVLETNRVAREMGEPFEVEYRIVTRSGEIKFIREVGDCIKDGKGAIVSLFGVAQDITKIKRAEQELLLKSDELDRYFTQSLDLLCIADTDGNFLRLNPEWEKVLGYPLDELSGRKFLDFVHPDDLAATLEAIAKLDAQEEILLFENRYRCKDGSYRWIEWRSRPTGKVIYAAARDVTGRKNAESALKESEERWKFALEGAGDGVWDWNPVTNQVFFSRQWKAMLGYADDEIDDTLDEWDRRLHPDDKSQVYADLERHLRSETDIYRNEHRLLCKNGTYKWVLDRGKVVARTEDGKPSRIIGTHSDISARKKSEMYQSMGQEILLLLNEQDSYLDGIQNVVSVIKRVTCVDAVGVRLQDKNDYPYFYQEGFSAEFLLKENSLLARTQDGGVCRDSNGNVCLECTCGLVLEGKTDLTSPMWTNGGTCWTNNSFPILQVPASQDSRVNPRNECIHQGFASVALIPIKAKGKVVGLLQLNDHEKDRFTLEEIRALEQIAGNIGEAMLRKQAEEKLSDSERFLRILTEQLPGMVSYWTSEFRCTFANNAYLEWFGKTHEQMIGITARELLGDELFALNEPYMRKALQGEPQSFERTIIKPGGEAGHTWAHYMPDNVDGTVRGFYVLVTDITDLKMAHEDKFKLETLLQQAQKMESVGRLAGGVAHDFNNKLTVILGNAELASMAPDIPEKVVTYLQEIIRAAEHSRDITGQLLAFSRQQVITPRVIDINKIIMEAQKSLFRMIGEDILLALNLGDRLWKVEIDPVQFDQVIMNLAVNARDAMPDGGTITITTRNVTLGESNPHGCVAGEYVKLEFTDTGAGIGKEIIDHLFEPFFTTKELGKGTGLGLATIYGIVKQNNGAISVSSEVGHGTIFSIYLPKKEGVENGKAEASKGYVQGTASILLVEDDEGVRKLTAGLLAQLGYTVHQAGSPRQALEIAADRSIGLDLVLTDVVMPGMDGVAMMQQIVKERPAIKAIYASGYTFDRKVLDSVKDSGNFLQKPYSIRTLSEMLANTLGTCQ